MIETHRILAGVLRRGFDGAAPRIRLDEDAWTQVVRKALDHGVAGLLARVIAEDDELEFADDIREAANAFVDHSTAEGQARVRETLEVLAALGREGIPALAFKGVALGQLAYDDPSLRPSRDIDVLVRRDHMARSVATLARLGYRATDTFGERVMDACYTTYGQDILFARNRLPVEPHWSFAPRPFSVELDLEGIRARAQTLDVAGHPLDTLALEDTLLVACLHGGKEKWWRLLWVADVAALVARHPAIDWDAVVARARDAGMLRMLHLGLGLARELFTTHLPASIAANIAGDATCTRLIAECERRLAADKPRSEPILRVSRFHVVARERLRDRWRYVLRTVTTPQFIHYRMVALPDRFALGYVPVKLVHDYLLLPVWRIRALLVSARRAAPPDPA